MKTKTKPRTPKLPTEAIPTATVELNEYLLDWMQSAVEADADYLLKLVENCEFEKAITLLRNIEQFLRILAAHI